MTNTIQQHKNAKVLVTGVTGYVGAHVANQLLLHGYKVRGTVRSTKDEARNEKLKQQITKDLPAENLPEFELFEADLLNEQQWPQAVAGCQFVCHVASPFPLEIPSNPETIIKPAVDGTLNVLKAAAADGNVKRVALTSSLAAIHDTKVDDPKAEPNKLFNEDDWVDENQVEPYSKSKILAEKAAVKFVNELPQQDGKRKLELVCINPCYVMGPLLTDSLSSSVLPVKRMLDKSMPALPKFNMAICDVRDVALAHVKALESAEHVGKRYLIFSESKWMKDVAAVIKKEFKPFGYFVPSLIVPSTLVWLSSFFDKSVALAVPRLDKEFRLDNRRMREELKITPIDTEQTIKDTVHSLIEKNIIKPTRRYTKATQQQEPAPNDKSAEQNNPTTTNAPEPATAKVGGDQ